MLLIFNALVFLLSFFNFESNWERLETDQAIIYYHLEDYETANFTHSILSNSILHIHDIIRSPIDEYRPIIYIASSEDEFYRLSGGLAPDWGEAIAIPGHKSIIIKSIRITTYQYSFKSVVLHELVHLRLHQTLDGNTVPVWFNEGLAMYLSGESGSLNLISRGLIGSNILYLDEIEELFRFKKHKAQLAYALSYSAIAYLVEYYGESILYEMISHFSGGKEIEAVIQSSLGINFIDFETDWFNYLANNYRWYFLLNFETLLWSLIPILFLLAYALVKFRNRKKLKQWEREEIDF